MAKIYSTVDAEGNSFHYFFCPGCKHPHAFDKRWLFNQDIECPTFSAHPGSTASLMCNGGLPDQCHLFLVKGKIQFQTDCYHELKGQTVECPEFHWGNRE